MKTNGILSGLSIWLALSLQVAEAQEYTQDYRKICEDYVQSYGLEGAERTPYLRECLQSFNAEGQEIADQASEEGFPLRSAIWNSPLIPVCWEDLMDSTQQDRRIVQRAVANTWEAYSDVRFTGWGECSNSSRGVRIEVDDVGPHVDLLGNQLDGRAGGMTLNFTYANWSPTCQFQRQFCSEVIAVHEFGHALAFAHEQNRNDTPSTCTDAPQGTNGDLNFGPWDLQSVMNYCNPNWNGNGQLSVTDVRMVQTFYGGIGAMEGHVFIEKRADPGFYLNLHRNDGRDGAEVNLWEDNGHISQEWNIHDDGTIRPAGHNNMCLNLHWNDNRNGATINSWTCNGHDSQQWRQYPDGTIRHGAFNDMCLNLHQDSARNGGVINLWSCNGHESQQWRIVHRNVVIEKDSDPGFYLNLHRNDGRDGAAVNLWENNGHISQEWNIHNDGTIRPAGHDNMCLNLHRNDNRNGATINSWTCNEHDSQQWRQYPDGTIRHGAFNDMCLNLHQDSARNGGVINLWSCNGHESQQWRVVR